MRTPFGDLIVLESDFKNLVEKNLSSYTMIKSEFKGTVSLINIQPKPGVMLGFLLMDEGAPFTTAYSKDLIQNMRVDALGDRTIKYTPLDGVPKVELASVIKFYEKGDLSEFIRRRQDELNVISWEDQIENMDRINKVKEKLASLSEKDAELLVKKVSLFSKYEHLIGTSIISGFDGQLHQLLRCGYNPEK